jgi:hypothetical protein|tara:strand:- start:84 stop:257 length:174 start_codon:yes stop_codon:yes gene_type:complete
MSFPFLILAGVSVLIFAQAIQTDSGTNQIPLFIYLVYALAGTLFLFSIIRAMRMLGR